MPRWITPLLAILLTATGLAGCTPAVVGTTAATGATVAHDRRTAGTFIEDQSIELKALIALRKDPQLRDQAHLNVTSYNMIVLLSGEAPSETLRQRAADIVRGIDRVRKVHNELKVAAPSSMMSRSSDTLITAKVKVGLFSIKDVPGFDPTRVKVVTENGTVYLMGLVRRVEGDAAAEAARRVSGVQRVVKLFEYLD
ncbi:BON domain-containing protein [Thiohalobacter sp. IOR34]|uniref:BON domain-containing protein n=1 Tax=Thiohalobacter sp. IOR34 TaxID=3057176 RepID=UPI0025AF2BAB|nr:BON domain-containing protein [Thiohalobacter sp. IOR34]WJW74833.1 BON domain-containing protein [Thiohalobacter sp. IOR34]